MCNVMIIVNLIAAMIVFIMMTTTTDSQKIRVS